MNLEDRLYSESEIKGVASEDSLNERMYSKYEVEEISDLFSDFYVEHGDKYASTDDAYAEFIDAYANVKISKNITRAGVGLAGAGMGYTVAELANKKSKSEIDTIEGNMVKGTAKASDIQRLEKLKKKIRLRKGIGTGVGALATSSALSYAGSRKDKGYSDLATFVKGKFDKRDSAIQGGPKASKKIEGKSVEGTDVSKKIESDLSSKNTKVNESIKKFLSAKNKK